ncbi:MAG: hypothetical protein EB116_19535 [Betaproteobacteria bacterium]|nr:hypothetical protein [Betaproteobacteria bacterium]
MIGYRWAIRGSWENDAFTGWLINPERGTFSISSRHDSDAYIFATKIEAEKCAEKLRYLLRKDDCKIEVKPLR